MDSKERIIELPSITDDRGNLSFVEARRHIPFDIARTYWIYDIPGGQERGSHAFHQQQEVLIALSGSFDVEIHDGKEVKTYTLNRSYRALYVPRMMWRTLKNFSTNSLCLVISSHPFEEADYIRDFDKFLSLKQIDDVHKSKESSPEKVLRENVYSTIHDCSLLEFPSVKNRAGNITPIHGGETIPFPIKRIFYIYDIPSEATRGMHAHKHCHEVLVAASGSFEVELNDGKHKRVVSLTSPRYGLHIPPGVWATERNYSSGAICIALASDRYEEGGYIKTFDEFLKYREDGISNI